MYILPANREDDSSELRRFMRENPLCALVSFGARGRIAINSDLPQLSAEVHRMLLRAASQMAPGT